MVGGNSTGESKDLSFGKAEIILRYRHMVQLEETAQRILRELSFGKAEIILRYRHMVQLEETAQGNLRIYLLVKQR